MGPAGLVRLRQEEEAVRSKTNWVAALELGTRQFLAAAGQADRSERLKLLALESVPAQGVKQGTLSDPAECADTVARLIRQVEQRLGARISKVLSAAYGNHLRSANASACVPILEPEVGVTRRDVERATVACRSLSLGYDRQILHAFEQGFSVDGQPGVENPVGLFGSKLTVHLHLVTGLNLAFSNLHRVMNRAGLTVEELVLPGLAAAEAILSDLDRDLGVAVIHLGETFTEAVLFGSGSARETLLIPWGTDHLTQALGRAFKLPAAACDQLLAQVGSLEERPDGTSVPLRVSTGSLVRTLAQEEVVRWLAGRCREFIGRLKAKLEESPYFREASSGVCMVGPLAQVGGFLEMAEEILNAPVRLGAIREVEIDPAIVIKPSHAALVGLLRLGSKRRAPSEANQLSQGPWEALTHRVRRVLEEYF